jgi:hypothetical protein
MVLCENLWHLPTLFLIALTNASPAFHIMPVTGAVLPLDDCPGASLATGQLELNMGAHRPVVMVTTLAFNR